MSVQLSEFVLAQALVEVTRTVPGVAGLYGGHFGEIATYGRSGRVPGIRIRTDEGQVMVEVHIIVTYAPNVSLLTLAETVRDQIRQHLTMLTHPNVFQPLGQSEFGIRLHQHLTMLATAKGGVIDVIIDDIAVPVPQHEMRAP